MVSENSNIDLKRQKKAKSSGLQMLKNYYDYVLKSEDFLKRIIEIRVKHEIPPEGYKYEETRLLDDKASTHEHKDKTTFHELLGIPADWEKEHPYRPHVLALEDDIQKLCEDFWLYDCFSWTQTIRNTVFFNIFPDLEDVELSYYDQCTVESGIMEMEAFEEILADYKGKGQRKYLNEYIETCKKLYKIRPVSIHISPYASQREIIDFVKKNFADIEEYQNKYRNPNIKIGKFKTRNPTVKERDEFILNLHNQGKTGKEIARLVKEKFGGDLLGYEYIPKIIFREKQKRQKL